jgi:NADH-quinone oxidoreductase subunit J
MFANLDAFLGPAYFWIFATAAVLCGIGLLLSRHPLAGAIHLIGVMLSLSGLYALFMSPFLAVVQVLVYAGAIMMLVVFVIMVLNQAQDHVVPFFDRLGIVALALPVCLGVVIIHTLHGAAMAGSAPAAQPVRGTVEAVASRMFDEQAGGPGYYLLFEITGVVLLAAVVAAVLLAKRTLDSPPEPAPPAVSGTDHPAAGARADASTSQSDPVATTAAATPVAVQGAT